MHFDFENSLQALREEMEKKWMQNKRTQIKPFFNNKITLNFNVSKVKESVLPYITLILNVLSYIYIYIYTYIYIYMYIYIEWTYF